MRDVRVGQRERERERDGAKCVCLYVQKDITLISFGERECVCVCVCVCVSVSVSICVTAYTVDKLSCRNKTWVEFSTLEVAARLKPTHHAAPCNTAYLRAENSARTTFKFSPVGYSCPGFYPTAPARRGNRGEDVRKELERQPPRSRSRSYNFLLLSLSQGILKGEVLLYHWPPVWLVWNQLCDNWQFLFLFEKQINPNQSNRRSTVQWYFPL